MLRRKHRRKHRIFLDLNAQYKLSFGDHLLDQRLDITWQALQEELKAEWEDFFRTFNDEEEQEDRDIIFYELSFSSDPDIETKIKDNKFMLESVSLDFHYDEEESFNEDSTVIPDDFEFDEFFLDYFYLFMLLSYFFFPFFLFELSFFSVYVFYLHNYFLINEEGFEDDDDSDPYDFLDSETDISHYDYAEFHFEEYLSFEEMFYYSGFWKNKPYSKHLYLFKKKN